MMTLQPKSNEGKDKLKIIFPEGILISDNNKEKKPLSDADKAWIDLIEYGETSDISPSNGNNKIVNDKKKK